jgi:hypothetical protein
MFSSWVTESSDHAEGSHRPSRADDPRFAPYPGLRCACPGLFSMAPYGSRLMRTNVYIDGFNHRKFRQAAIGIGYAVHTAMEWFRAHGDAP